MWAFAALATLGACTRPATREDNVLRLAIETRAGNLDPRHSTDAASGRLGEVIFSRLVKYDAKLNIVPDLATHWELEDEGRLYRFHLRQGVRFHDGSELDAQDVAFTFNSILDENTASPKRQGYAMIERIDVPDPHTIEFRLKAPNAPFLTNMILGILPAETAQGKTNPAVLPVGSGPFRVVENDNGSVLRLEAFAEHFAGRPPLNGLVVRAITDPTLRVLELTKGTIDFVQNDFIPEFIPGLRKDENIRVQAAPGINCSYLAYNLRHPILGKQPVRQAIAHAIDRETILAFILRDTASPANSILGPTVLGYSAGTKVPEYDLAKAKALLDEAGYPDPDGDGPKHRFSLLYKTSTDKVRLRVADVVRRNLGEVGINVTVQSYELSTFLSDVKTGNFEMYTLTWVGIADPDGLYNIFHSSSMPPNGSNRVFYSNKEVDALLERGRVETDLQARAELYRKVQEIVGAELPLLPLWYTNNVACVRADVRGFELYPAGNYYSFAKVSVEPPSDGLAVRRE